MDLVVEAGEKGQARFAGHEDCGTQAAETEPT
jgi:hypothetical protein